MLTWRTAQTSGADKPGTLLVLPTFHLFQLLHSSTLTVFLFSQFPAWQKKRCLFVFWVITRHAYVRNKKKWSIFFLHLYYFYCSGMPQVLSQMCCLLFLTLPLGNQILHIFCGAVQWGGNLLLFLTDRSGLMHVGSSGKRDTIGSAATALQLTEKLRLGVHSTFQETSWESSHHTFKPGDVCGVQTPSLPGSYWLVNFTLNPLCNLAHLVMLLICTCFVKIQGKTRWSPHSSYRLQPNFRAVRAQCRTRCRIKLCGLDPSHKADSDHFLIQSHKLTISQPLWCMFLSIWPLN